MYIIVSNNPEATVKMSRKLHKALDFKGTTPLGAISISKIKGQDKFVIVKRTAEETFEQQCSLVTKTGDKRTPSEFHWTTPSLEYFKAITGTSITNTKVLKVAELQAGSNRVFIIKT